MASMLTSQTILFNKVHIIWLLVLHPFKLDFVGFHTLTEALTEAQYGPFNSDRMQDADRLNLKQLFFAPSEGRDYGMGYKALSEQYKTYKENYVKYIKFDPLKPSPGKDSLTISNKHKR